MGTNNRQRRAAKVKAKGRSRQPAPGPRRTDPPSVSPAGARSQQSASPAEVARLVQRCSHCGSGELDWTSAGELAALVPEDARERATQGAAFFGEQTEAWLCRECGTFGLLSS